MMASLSASSALRACAAAVVLSACVGTTLAHSAEDLARMGPLGFLWPPDRPWSGDEEGMRGPCGSSAGVGNRTDFPLGERVFSRPTYSLGGALALEQKQEVFDVQVSVSLESDPTSTTIFTPYMPAAGVIDYLNFAHVCINLTGTTNTVTTAAVGTNATLQLRYTAEWIDPNHTHDRRGAALIAARHTPVNRTFYACADVRFVAPGAKDWDAVIPCFNVSASSHQGGGGAGAGHDHDESSDQPKSSGGGAASGLSGQAIAGITVGTVVGVAVIATVAWYLYRRDRREKLVAQHLVGTGGAEKSITLTPQLLRDEK